MRAGTTGEWTNALSLAPNFNGSIYVKMLTAATGNFHGSILHVTNNASDMTIALSGTVTPPQEQLWISSSVNTSKVSNNKAIEIFNGTGMPVT